MSIHPTASVHPDARLGANVEIGPGAVVDSDVEIGDDVRIWAHAYLTGHTRIGAGTEIHMGAVVGHVPQDRAFSGDEPTYLEIGERNVIREHATIHRATGAGASTVIGSDCFIMAHAHVAHDCRVADGAVLCNNVLLSGYVEVGRKAFISGNVSVHQFARIGELCMISGGSAVGRDVPPFTTASGRNRIRGINVVGLRRDGRTAEERLAIRAAYRRLFAARDDLAAAVATLEDAPDLEAIDVIREFYRESKRGFLWPSRRPPAES